MTSVVQPRDKRGHASCCFGTIQELDPDFDDFFAPEVVLASSINAHDNNHHQRPPQSPSQRARSQRRVEARRRNRQALQAAKQELEDAKREARQIIAEQRARLTADSYLLDRALTKLWQKERPEPTFHAPRALMVATATLATGLFPRRSPY